MAADTYPGCYANYGDAYPPNNCKTCPVEVQCLSQTLEDLNR